MYVYADKCSYELVITENASERKARVDTQCLGLEGRFCESMAFFSPAKKKGGERQERKEEEEEERSNPLYAELASICRRRIKNSNILRKTT